MWQERAACLGKAELMFEQSTMEKRAEQDKVCRECPVLNECLRDCRETELVMIDIHGFRAGRSQQERQKVRAAQWKREMERVA